MSLTRPPRMLFVLAQGRSGTAFLADLLNRAPRTLVQHERPGDPVILSLSRYGRSSRVVAGLLEERFREALPGEGEVDLYGEVNSYLRYNVEWLRDRFDPLFVHVTRDGRDFVRSASERAVFLPQQRQLPIVPTDDDPFAAEWAGMSRFERICWIWRHTNEMLGDAVTRHVRLEDLLASFGAFRAALLEPTGLEIEEAAWRAAVEHPRNTSAGHRRAMFLRRLIRGEASGERLPHWSRWPDSHTESFWRICGAAMERFGYGRSTENVSAPSSTEV